jgi:dTDP-4-amino-4,6-dideoxygalactose transaminase
MIPFNKPFIIGNEIDYIKMAVESGKISGNGNFTQKCNRFLERKFNFAKCLLTTSCTDALEMAAILCNIAPDDEVIVPSFTFVSSALAFIRLRAKIVFADSRSDHPGIDESKIEDLITPRTKAIVVVHYAGIACDMDIIMKLAEKHNLYVIEDAAQAIDSLYKGKPLGGIGNIGCFSFHETKNIMSGEGGVLVVNDKDLLKRAEVIWEKGTNRAEFFRGEVNKYGWMDTGSSFLPSEITAAFLLAQLERLDIIQQKRQKIWCQYYDGLIALETAGKIKLPEIPSYSTNNYHMFYIICETLDQRSRLLSYLKSKNITAVSHYLPLHLSQYYGSLTNEIPELKLSVYYSDCILRLPFYYELGSADVRYIAGEINNFFKI